MKTIAIIGGTAVASVIAVRIFDKHLAPRLGMGPDTKALPPSDEETEQQQPKAFQMPMSYNPYMNLTPLPPPQMIPVAIPFGMPPQMPAWPMFGQQQQQQPQIQYQNRIPRQALSANPARVQEEVEDEGDSDNILAFMREAEGDD